jgi:hypothetical protein
MEDELMILGLLEVRNPIFKMGSNPHFSSALGDEKCAPLKAARGSGLGAESFRGTPRRMSALRVLFSLGR